MAKHTPGPWRMEAQYGLSKEGQAKGLPLEFCFFDIRDSDDRTVGSINPAYFDKETQAANARLIAAAPGMLEQLERCLENIRTLNALIYERCPDLRSGTSDTELMAERVIAKAKGES